MRDFHQFAFENKIAFVTYKLPESEEIITLIQWKTEPIMLSSLKELEGKSGFVYAPFDLSSRHPIRLIEPNIIVKGDEFDKSFFNIYKQNQRAFKVHKDNIEYTPVETPRKNYIFKAEELKNEIRKGKLHKLVLSRISIEEKPKSFTPTLFFQKLQNRYPDAFVYMIYISDSGLWLGASPEPLMEIMNNQVSTVSLAGTRLHTANSNSVEWGTKEIEEQEMVTGYIDSTLKNFDIKRYKKQGPQTKHAGAVEHLITSFSFDLNAIQSRILEFLNAIHPTPSVCGLPKEIALERIKESEEHDREYYTGFLGPFNFNKKYNLFVNLRCMKVEVDQFIFFLGAGITSGSIPEKEWDETNSKKRTLMTIVETLN